MNPCYLRIFWRDVGPTAAAAVAAMAITAAVAAATAAAAASDKKIRNALFM